MVVVDLGPLRQKVEERVKSGSYASADEVIRAGLLALEREEADTSEWLVQLAEDRLPILSLASPLPMYFESCVRFTRRRFGSARVEEVRGLLSAESLRGFYRNLSLCFEALQPEDCGELHRAH